MGNAEEIELAAKNLPCDVVAEFEPKALSFKNEIQHISKLRLSASDDAKSGDYTIYIVAGKTAKLYLSPGTVATDDFDNTLLDLRLRIS